MSRRYLCTLLFITSCTLSVCAQNIDATWIDSLVATKIADNAPGMAVGIVQNGKIVYESYLGYANLEHLVPVDEDSKFNIASNAKQFTALCLLRLIRDGKLGLEQELRSILPGYFSDVSPPIKIKHLLTHSSGIRDYSDLAGLQGKAWWRRIGWSNEDVLELLAKQQELNFAPGSRYGYSNSNYTLMTEIIKQITGSKFSDYAADFFAETGLLNTEFCTNYMAVISNKALPYSNWGDGRWQQYPMMVDLHGDGFLYTTLRDQLRWEQLLQNGTLPIADAGLLQVSQEPVKGAKITHYGYGVEIEQFGPHTILEHSGGTGSYGAHFIRFPEQKLAVVVMGNNGNVWYTMLARDIAGRIMGVTPPERAPAVLPASDADTGVSPQQIAGLYQAQDGKVATIEYLADTLYWKTYGRKDLVLESAAPNTFAPTIYPRSKICYTESDTTRSVTVYNPGESPREYLAIPPEETLPESYFATLEGHYINQETGVEIQIEYLQEKEFRLTRGKRKSEARLILKDYLRTNGYRLNIVRDSFDRVTHFLLEYARNSNIRFERITETAYSYGH